MITGSDCEGTIQHDHAEFARRKLEEQGHADEWEVVIADDYHLQVDLDDCGPIEHGLPERFHTMFDIFKKHIDPEAYVERHTTSKSGTGQHVIINTNQRLHPHARIAWQSILGSDCLREGLAMCSVWKHELNPILLFERKQQ